jgi:hypothetical protein
MRVQLRKARTAIAGAMLTLAAACGRGSDFGGPTPVAILPSSPQTAAAFGAIRTAWIDLERSKPEVLRAMLESFLSHYPHDEVVPLAEVALALVALRQSDVATADVELQRTVGLPAGTVRDLWTVASAKRLRLGGDPDAALALLRPLVGKSVDPIARSIFEEELTLTALATHRDYEAISYMDAWLRASGDEHKPSVIARVGAMVAQLPEEVLVGALRAMRSRRSRLGYGVEIQRILFDRLVQIATTSGDAQLARMLLDEDSEGLSMAVEVTAALGELANSGRGLNIVHGQTIGLLLPTESPGLRDESADVLRGAMWALGLPRGVRALGGTPSAASTRSGDAMWKCAALQPVPDAAELGPDEGVRLVTRNDAGIIDRTELSLDELAGEGAAVVIAALDSQTAARAMRWAESHSVAVIVLVPPTQQEASPAFGFVLGEPRNNVVSALVRAAPALDIQPVTPVVDKSELGDFSPHATPVDGVTFAAPVSCDAVASWAGEPRFPVRAWDREGVVAWLVSGSPGCSSDVVSELTEARAHGVVALTLEAAGLPLHTAGLRVVSAHAGVVPATGPDDPRQDELQRFSATLGPIGWWTALGRDASTLARLAVQRLPDDEARDAATVAARRTAVRDALAAAHTRLWTTEMGGWAAAHVMRRTVCAIDVPMR